MNDSRRRRTAAASCLAVTGALLAAGCGGEASGSSTETSSLKGAPVKVMVWNPEDTQGSAQPGVRLTAQAYEKWINANGGIKGGPLKVITCNEKNDPDEAEKCAQQAVAEKVVAVVGSYSLAGDRYMPILEKAGIPYIGGTGVSAAEFSNPLSFPVNGGTPTVFAAHGQQLVEEGCKKISGVRYDVAAAETVARFLALGVTSAGASAPKDLKVPVTATDLAPQVAAATKGRDCVSVILGTHSDLFVKAYVQSGTKTKVGSVVGNLTPELAETTGGSSSPLEGATITGYYPPTTDAVWKDFVAAAEGSDIDTSNGANGTAWVAFKVFTEAAKKLPTISSKALVEELNTTSGIDTGGLTPPLTWNEATALPIKGMNRIHNTTATELSIRDGKIEWAKEGSTFVDVRKVLTAMSAG
ncbi:MULTISPECIES: ABC transporter substrate-binding protein [unclassified Streptomyces]|uniref:ABC transporter substrate-binding protein n=1 Tax=unclassified Streptomyces TaxID=2593676 RepID=UPI002E793C8F|nr:MULTISPECIES: ABC transporter substrate-binding protein [unclassified Streptomyces]MEE1762796.1 ABC transporter substrate-binding protein [Streptomyces sp. SP18BB07]MEE1833060.1 ABC transporter substrate-binding protein [Streptomyces sp. SP17KL33]